MSSLRRVLPWILASVLFAAGKARADTICMRDGRVIEGQVLARDETSVRIRMRAGIEIEVPAGQVESIETNARGVDLRNLIPEDGTPEDYLDICRRAEEAGEFAIAEEACRAGLARHSAHSGLLEALDELAFAGDLYDASHAEALQARVLDRLREQGAAALPLVTRMLEPAVREFESQSEATGAAGLRKHLSAELRRRRERALDWLLNETEYDKAESGELRGQSEAMERVRDVRLLWEHAGDRAFLRLHDPYRRAEDAVEYLLQAHAAAEGAASERDIWRRRIDAAQARIREGVNFPKDVRLSPDVAAMLRANDVFKLAPECRAVAAAINDYRLLLGLPPLQVNPSLCAAAQGHCDEMAKLSYFAHESPTPERREPVDRVRLTRYRLLESENAVVGEVLLQGPRSAADVLDGWLSSPRHHRCLVKAAWREIGIGRTGDLWAAVAAVPEREPLTIQRQLRLKDAVADVAVAQGGEALRRGLMFVQWMPETQGMLFVFDRPDVHSFWMKNTLIPLDIAFVDEHGRIAVIHGMHPLTENGHSSEVPVQYALEMNLGWFAAHGIAAGDVIENLPEK